MPPPRLRVGPASGCLKEEPGRWGPPQGGVSRPPPGAQPPQPPELPPALGRSSRDRPPATVPARGTPSPDWGRPGGASGSSPVALDWGVLGSAGCRVQPRGSPLCTLCPRGRGVTRAGPFSGWDPQPGATPAGRHLAGPGPRLVAGGSGTASGTPACGGSGVAQVGDLVPTGRSPVPFCPVPPCRSPHI